MSFRQQVAKKFVDARTAYDTETQRLQQLWVAEIKEKLMKQCEAAADQRQLSCTMLVDHPNHIISSGVPPDSLQQQLQGLLAELGFQDGSVKPFEGWKDGYFYVAHTLTAKWAAEDATSTSPERSPKAASGTCVTCPICHEHGPAVALVPCGHVVCRDCHRSKQLRQCPMCRKVITSATQGLFID